jgi:phosphoribosyl-ATP pyrophosphohydrolase
MLYRVADKLYHIMLYQVTDKLYYIMLYRVTDKLYHIMLYQVTDKLYHSIPVCSNNKTDLHDIAEILLNVALSTTTLTHNL